jgi:hypothetical protein
VELEFHLPAVTFDLPGVTYKNCYFQAERSMQRAALDRAPARKGRYIRECAFYRRRRHYKGAAGAVSIKVPQGNLHISFLLLPL